MRTVRWVLAVVAALAVAAGGYYAYARFAAVNFGVVEPGQVYRSAQPSPERLKAWIARYGLKTIINLRTDIENADYAAESAAAAQAGAAAIHIRLPSTDLPESPRLMYLADLLESAPRPMLLHCREGADRTGLASVMARMAVGGKPYDEARGQMSIRFFHVDNDPEHVAGVLQQYEAWCRAQGAGTGGWREFRQWLFNVYKPSYCYVTIDVPRQLAARPGEEVRLTARIVNRSARTIPCGDPARRFALAVIASRPFRGTVSGRFCPPVPLARADIPPGGEAAVDVAFAAPAQAGQYPVLFDVLEGDAAYFNMDGSPLACCELTVAPGPGARP
jgi:protein tyrosine/serine phosphatase